MILNLDHIAILTLNLSATASQLSEGLIPENPEQQPAEGTLEQYVCLPSDTAPALLLMQAVDDGPYRTALKKRGPGLHHLGFTTDSIDKAVQHFHRRGLLLHPHRSLKNLPGQIGLDVPPRYSLPC